MDAGTEVEWEDRCEQFEHERGSEFANSMSHNICCSFI
jgi:hypothetical protein